jgi:hypothetical protein
VNRAYIKKALIPILGLALLAVLRGPSTETSESAAPRARRPEIPIAEAATRRAARRPRELSEIIEFDPFASPQTVLQAGVTAKGETATVPQAAMLRLGNRLRIEAIVKRDGAFQAVIAGKVVHLGELVDEGRYRVTAITADNVTFRRADVAP